MSSNQSSREDVSMHNICDTCRVACQRSVTLSDSTLVDRLQRREAVVVDPDDPRFPLRQTIRDVNQWNQDSSYLFENELPHHTNAAAFEASVESGCHLCCLLWHHLSLERYGILECEVDLEKKKMAEESRAVAREQIKRTKEQIRVRFFVTDSQRAGHNPRHAGVVLYTGSCVDTLPTLRSALLISPTDIVEAVTCIELRGDTFARLRSSTSSNQTIAQAKKWVEECHNQIGSGQTHSRCSRSFRATSWPTPTRLLELQPTSVTLRVNLSLGVNAEVKYACLSHCWGGADSLKLTTANIDSLQTAGIAISSLPATYRDAIDITKRIGLRYFWIDSLCIIQDSISDWRQEASKMSEVYSYAFVTVAALAASNSHGGCYFSINPQSYWPCVLPQLHNVSFTVWYGRLWPFHNERLTNAPLLTRGWVMQERCLGPRILYFGRFGLYWECATMRADEVFVGGFEHDGIGDTGGGLSYDHQEVMMKALINRRLYLVGQNSCSMPIHVRATDIVDGNIHPWVVWKFLVYWYTVVGSYSQTRLTFGKDKLVALGGVIELVQNRTGMTSLAGLWREVVLDDMLWSCSDSKSASRPIEYRAPSFSWASVDGRIQRKFDRMYCQIVRNFFLTPFVGIPHSSRVKYLAEVVSDEVETIDPMRHTGEIVKAQLVLQAVVVRYTTNRGFYKDGRVFWSHPWRQDIDKFKGGVFGRWLELDVQSDGESGSLDVALIPILAWYRENEQAQEETKDASKEDMNESTKSSTDYEIFHVAGLVLQCVDKSKNIFRRIGIFEHCSGELDESEGGARDSWTVGREKESLTLV